MKTRRVEMGENSSSSELLQAQSSQGTEFVTSNRITVLEEIPRQTQLTKRVTMSLQ